MLVCDRSPVNHYFKLEPRRIVFLDIQVFKQSEHKVRHEVHSQDIVKLLLYLRVSLIDQDWVYSQFESV